MAGEGSGNGAMGQMLTIPASHFTPVDANLIPTGELRQVEGSVFDFRQARRVADGLRDGTDQQIVYGRGFDHNLAHAKGVTARQEHAARPDAPASAIRTA